MTAPPAKSDEAAAEEVRSAGLRLLGRAFLHPDRPFHEELRQGRFARAVEELCRSGWGIDCRLPAIQTGMSDFEAEFIRTFHTGPQAAIGLHAGDYEQLLEGRSRPELLLEYTRWYRHFGLQANRGTPASQLPDHVSCQLDFLAALCQYEQRAGEAGLRAGYRLAQRDFVQRLLLPFAAVLGARLRTRRGELPRFYSNLVELMNTIGTRWVDEITRANDQGGDR